MIEYDCKVYISLLCPLSIPLFLFKASLIYYIIIDMIMTKVTTKINGLYYYGDLIIGKVEDCNVKTWFGKVTLLGLEEFSEYGTLDQNASVQDELDGNIYTSPY